MWQSNQKYQNCTPMTMVFWSRRTITTTSHTSTRPSRCAAGKKPILCWPEWSSSSLSSLRSDFVWSPETVPVIYYQIYPLNVAGVWCPHFSYLSVWVHEIFGHVRRTVFLGDFAWWVEIPSFIFLRCWEVVGAPLAFLVSRPPDFTAKSRDSEIASTLTTKRTPSFAARWLNSSQKLLLCSKNQQNFRDLKNIASSPRYGDFSERGHKIHWAA